MIPFNTYLNFVKTRNKGNDHLEKVKDVLKSTA